MAHQNWEYLQLKMRKNYFTISDDAMYVIMKLMNNLFILTRLKQNEKKKEENNEIKF